eukprot:2034406-Prymnesium_polylepis.1
MPVHWGLCRSIRKWSPPQHMSTATLTLVHLRRFDQPGTPETPLQDPMTSTWYRRCGYSMPSSGSGTSKVVPEGALIAMTVSANQMWISDEDDQKINATLIPTRRKCRDSSHIIMCHKSLVRAAVVVS